MQLMRSDMGSSNALAAMLASCNAQMGYQGGWVGVDLVLED